MEPLMHFVTAATDQYSNLSFGEVMVAPEDGACEDYCEDAQLFQTWIDREIVSKVRYTKDVLKINQAMFMLQRKFFDAQSAADREHKYYTGHDHICLCKVYFTAYAELNKLLLWETPPQILPPEVVQRLERRNEPRTQPGQFIYTNSTVLGDEEDN